ncbi:uncharacterized protein LOC133176905 [Saccostrea echinata]|uniref:uncharacterized protein LOC133176905 n=1 Tax=Saccostrea echinata TaxID=191078 RepID=UPI002A800B97|nr:uncharacterized protein LOC133176905 [Saccostrea echinata]
MSHSNYSTNQTQPDRKRFQSSHTAVPGQFHSMQSQSSPIEVLEQPHSGSSSPRKQSQAVPYFEKAVFRDCFLGLLGCQIGSDWCWYQEGEYFAMRTTLECGIIVFLNFAVFADSEEKDSITYEFGKDCPVFLRKLDENLQIYVQYKGKFVHWMCKYFSFEGIGIESLDEYIICVRPQYFNDPDCAVTLEYKSTFDGATLANVTCSNNFERKFCGDRDEFLYIYLETRDEKPTSNTSFKLLVTAERVFNYGSFALPILGGVIGGIVLIGVLTAVICRRGCRRKTTQSQILRAVQGTSGSTVNQCVEYNIATSTEQSEYSTSQNYNLRDLTKNASTCNSFASSKTDCLQQAETSSLSPPPTYDEKMLSLYFHVLLHAWPPVLCINVTGAYKLLRLFTFRNKVEGRRAGGYHFVEKMLIGCTIFFVSYFTSQLAEGIETQEYNFGEDCSTLQEVNEDRQIHLDYEGQRVRSCYYMSFEGQGEDISDEYQVCVTPKWFRDPDCSVEIIFRSGYMGKKLKSFTCTNSYEPKFCADNGDSLYVYFDTRTGKSTSNVSFRFLITATKVLDYSNLVWAIIGGVIGGIVFVTLLTALFCWCVCKRKPATGQVLRSAGQVTTITQPAYPYANYSAQPTGNIAPFPAPNYSTQYSTGYGTQPPVQSPQTVEWQQTQKQASAPPPPSYDEL